MPNPHLPHPHLPHGLVSFPRPLLPWIEPWFLAYACLGIVQGGMLPLLLPLSAGGASQAGLIVGMMNLTGLSAPLWGHLADRRRLHRQVLLGGMFVTLLALLLMPAQLGLTPKLVLAGVLGVGLAAANTVANMFIVEVRPQAEWDARIGALQALSGIGQIIGLLLAGFIGGRFALAFGVAAALVAAALPIAWLTLEGIQVPVPRSLVTAHPSIGCEGWVCAPQRLFHLATLRGVTSLLRTIEVPFARLMVVWGLAFVAISAVLTIFPVALIREFDVSTGTPATAYAFAAAASLLGYPLAGAMSKSHGALPVLRAGFAVRAAAIAVLTIPLLSRTGGLPLCLAGFVVLVLGWPLLSVSGTALAAQFAPGEKGEALGLFNAVSSLAGALGAFLGGWWMATASYGTLCLLAALVVGLSGVASVALLQPPARDRHSYSVSQTK